MKVALLGATSRIALDYLLGAPRDRHYLLYARDLARLAQALGPLAREPFVALREYATYGSEPHDVVVNFVGVGDPDRTREMGAAILDVTAQYDALVLSHLGAAPHRKYVFFSSGAVYGDSFARPVDEATPTVIPVNTAGLGHCYALAKLQAEVRHRCLPDQAIVDLRVFNYFSRTQGLGSKLFLAEALACVRDGREFATPARSFHRDFVAPGDLFALLEKIIAGPRHNGSVDCRSRAPVEKFALLDMLRERFGLRYRVEAGAGAPPNVTGFKEHYYSLDTRAHRVFGHEARYTSLEAVAMEASAVLGR